MSKMKFSQKAQKQLNKLQEEAKNFIQEKIKPLLGSEFGDSTLFPHFYKNEPPEDKVVENQTFEIPGITHKKIAGFNLVGVIYQEPIGAFEKKFSEMKIDELLILVAWLEDNFQEFKDYVEDGRKKLSIYYSIQEIVNLKF